MHLLRPLLLLFNKQRAVLKFGVVLAFATFSTALLLTTFDHSTFPTLFEALWFSVITVFTVGFGDLVPDSTIGKCITMLLIVFGSIIISYFSFSIAVGVAKHQERLLTGDGRVSLDQHIIIVGWSEKTRRLIEQLLHERTSHNIVVIDSTLERLPLTHLRLTFIRGQSTIDDTWERAHIKSAEMVVITADQNMNEHDADLTTIMSALVVKSLNKHTPCIIEILTRTQLRNAERIGVEHIIETYQKTSELLRNTMNHFF
ncbi:MAG: potassium channel family protein [Bacilli bacterium]